MKKTKGVYQRMKENVPQTLPKITKESLESFLNKMYSDGQKQRENNEENRKNVFKHLAERSKLLKKPIPLELLALFSGNPPYLVGNEMYQKFREWTD